MDRLTNPLIQIAICPQVQANMESGAVVTSQLQLVDLAGRSNLRMLKCPKNLYAYAAHLEHGNRCIDIAGHIGCGRAISRSYLSTYDR